MAKVLGTLRLQLLGTSCGYSPLMVNWTLHRNKFGLSRLSGPFTGLIIAIGCALVLTACTGGNSLESPAPVDTGQTTSGGSTSGGSGSGGSGSGGTGSGGTGSGSTSGTGSSGTTSSGSASTIGTFELLDPAETTYLPTGSLGIGSGGAPRTNSDVRTPEYLMNPVYDVVHLNEALKWNVTGNGVTIAVIDSGIDQNHLELKSNIDAKSSISVVGGSFDDSSRSSHGTMVAGIAAGQINGIGMHGVAPNADLLAIKVTSDGNLTLANQEAGMEAARLRGADIINISFGLAGYEHLDLQSAVATQAITTSLLNTYQKGVDADIIYTLAAGNSGDAQPEWDGKIAGYGVANGQILVVGSLNSAGTGIADFSNRAGDAKAYYLLAPGEDIVTTKNDGNLTTTSGTSFAAPFVAGAAALVKSAGPSTLSAKDVVAILLTTADDLGAAGIDRIYGAGRLNIEAALSPVGPTSLALEVDPNGKRTDLDNATVSNEGLVAGTLERSALLNRVLFFDGFDRPYLKDVTTASSVTNSSKGAVSWMTNETYADSSTLSQTTSLALAYAKEQGQRTHDVNALQLSIASQISDDTEARFVAGRDWALGLTSNKQNQGQLPHEIRPEGILSLAQSGAGIGISQNLNNDTRLSVVLGGSLKTPAKPVTGNQQLGFISLDHAITPATRLQIGTGMLNETGQILGTALGSAFAATHAVKTPFTKLAYHQQIANSLNLGMSYSVGRVQGYDNIQNTSLVTGFTGGRLDAAELWIGRTGKRQTLQLGVSRELGFRSGQMTLNVPSTVAYEDGVGKVGFTSETINMKSATIYGLGLAYQRTLQNGGQLKLLGRLQTPLNRSTAITGDAMVKYSKRF